MEGAYFNMVKAVYDKPISNIMLNRKYSKFLVSLGTSQGCPVSPLLFNIVVEDIARAIQQEKAINVIQIKEEIRASLFEDSMTLYIRDPKDSTQNS